MRNFEFSHILKAGLLGAVLFAAGMSSIPAEAKNHHHHRGPEDTPEPGLIALMSVSASTYAGYCLFKRRKKDE